MVSNKNKKAFTLIELIVVITILSILGTIAFVQMGSYSSDARDTKRTSDLGQLEKKIELSTIEGGDYKDFVESDAASIINNEASNSIKLGGFYGYSAISSKYDAGFINHTALGLKDGDFKDPKTLGEYKIGMTSIGDRYEIAATLENGGSQVAYVRGNYTRRTTSGTTVNGTGTIGNNTFTLDDKLFSQTLLEVGDQVRIGSDTTKYIITEAKGRIITVNNNFVANGSTIFIDENESVHIIQKHDSEYPIDESKGSTHTPYKIN